MGVTFCFLPLVALGQSQSQSQSQSNSGGKGKTNQNAPTEYKEIKKEEVGEEVGANFTDLSKGKIIIKEKEEKPNADIKKTKIQNGQINVKDLKEKASSKKIETQSRIYKVGKRITIGGGGILSEDSVGTIDETGKTKDELIILDIDTKEKTITLKSSAGSGGKIFSIVSDDEICVEPKKLPSEMRMGPALRAVSVIGPRITTLILQEKSAVLMESSYAQEDFSYTYCVAF